MRKFLIGCGVVLGLGLVVTLGSSWWLLKELKRELPDMHHLEEQQEELRRQFGELDEYTPPLDGRVDPGRMEAYLRVREALPRDDTGFVEAIEGVSQQEERVKEAKGFGKIQEMYRIAKQGMGVARVAMEYLTVRDSVLLVEGMGPGEYVYLTTVGPILELHHDPERCAPELGERLSTQDAESLDKAHHALLRIFRDQLANARRELRGMETRSEAQESYLAALDDEFERGRIGDEEEPFAAGLPVETRESLEPFRERLEESLPRCRETWSLELLVATDKDNRGLQVEFGSDDDD